MGQPARHPGAARRRRAQGFKQHPHPGDAGASTRAPRRTTRSTPAYLDRVKEVVDWALADGPLRDDQHAPRLVAVDQHDARPATTTCSPATTRSGRSWPRAFRDHPPQLMFESINEPQFTGSRRRRAGVRAAQRAQHRRSTRSCAQSGGNNADPLLVLPTLHTSADQARVDALVATFTALNDPNLIATVPLLRLLAVQRERRRRHPVRRDRPAGRHGRLRPRAQHVRQPRASRSSSASTGCSASTGTPAPSSRARS